MSKLLYGDKVWRRTIHYLDAKRVPEDKYAKYYDTTLIMLERAMRLAIILLFVKCRFQNTDLMVSIMLKYGQ